MIYPPVLEVRWALYFLIQRLTLSSRTGITALLEKEDRSAEEIRVLERIWILYQAHVVKLGAITQR